MKIRITALMLAVVMLLTLLSGCGAAETEPEATTMAATEEPTVESTTESATETTKETGPKTVMVPKEATVHELKERKAKAWEYTWFLSGMNRDIR